MKNREKKIERSITERTLVVRHVPTESEIKKLLSEIEIIFEDDLFIIVADKYRQTSIGSICLLIPKKHYKNILELSDDHSKRLISILKNINYAMQKAYNCIICVSKRKLEDGRCKMEPICF